MFTYRKEAKGFTLVEIMIVVAIIALIAAIAIPNLLRARHNANETVAIGNIRTLGSALESFRAAQTPKSYPVPGGFAGLALLSGAAPPYVDATLTAAAGRQGYTFTYTPGGAVAGAVNTYTLTAIPSVGLAGVSGTRSFFVDQSGVIRVNAAGAAPVVGDPPLD